MQESIDLQTHSRRQRPERRERQRYSETEREIYPEVRGGEQPTEFEVDEWEMENQKALQTDGNVETGPDPVYGEEERSGDYDWETEEDVDRERGGGEEEEEDLEREREELDKERQAELELERTEQEGERDLEREEWERRRVEMERGRQGGHFEETGQPYPYPPQYFYLKVRPHCTQSTLISI